MLLRRLLSLINIHSIYWKVFISFWLAMVMILAGSVIVTVITVQSSEQHREMKLALETHASAGRAAYEIGAESGLVQWLRHHESTDDVLPYWLDESNKDLLHRRLPKPIKWYLKQKEKALIAIYPGMPTVTAVRMSDGREYEVMMIPPNVKMRHPSKAMPFMRGLSEPYAWTMIIVAVVVTGIISFVLVRYHIVPIKKLREASRKLAAGALNTRVDSAVTQRRDELGMLARDFNAMTAKLNTMITGQQRMLRDISHELRSPLARMRVALELARNKSSGDAEDEFDRLEQESERLDRLIEEIMSLVRLNHKQDILQTEPVDLAQVLTDIVNDAVFEARAVNKSVSLNVTAPAIIDGDEILLQRAFENIVRNAIKYTPEHSAVLIELTQANADYCRVAVCDFGEGVPEAELLDIFKPFYRVSEARDRHSGGHGLGLTIAASIVQIHGGEIRAKNVEGGFVVEAELPLWKTEA